MSIYHQTPFPLSDQLTAISPLFIDQFVGVHHTYDLQLSGAFHTLHTHSSHVEHPSLFRLFAPPELDAVWESEWLIQHETGQSRPKHKWNIATFSAETQSHQLVVQSNQQEQTMAQFGDHLYRVTMERLDEITIQLIFENVHNSAETLICTEAIVPTNDCAVDVLIVYANQFGSSELYGRLHAMLIPSIPL